MPLAYGEMEPGKHCFDLFLTRLSRQWRNYFVISHIVMYTLVQEISMKLCKRFLRNKSVWTRYMTKIHYCRVDGYCGPKGTVPLPDRTRQEEKLIRIMNCQLMNGVFTLGITLKQGPWEYPLIWEEQD